MTKNLALFLAAFGSAFPLGASGGNATSPGVTSKTTIKPITTPIPVKKPYVKISSPKTTSFNSEPESSPTPKNINDNSYNFFSPTFFVAIILTSTSCLCCLYHGFKRASELRGDGNPGSEVRAEASAALVIARQQSQTTNLTTTTVPEQTLGRMALERVVGTEGGSESRSWSGSESRSGSESSSPRSV
ncbi:MAG: hypothetical protein ACKN9I_06120 [Alphaproteobacteria bacterium]